MIEFPTPSILVFVICIQSIKSYSVMSVSGKPNCHSLVQVYNNYTVVGGTFTTGEEFFTGTNDNYDTLDFLNSINVHASGNSFRSNINTEYFSFQYIYPRTNIKRIAFNSSLNLVSTQSLTLPPGQNNYMLMTADTKTDYCYIGSSGGGIFNINSLDSGNNWIDQWPISSDFLIVAYRKETTHLIVGETRLITMDYSKTSASGVYKISNSPVSFIAFITPKSLTWMIGFQGDNVAKEDDGVIISSFPFSGAWIRQYPMEQVQDTFFGVVAANSGSNRISLFKFDILEVVTDIQSIHGGSLGVSPLPYTAYVATCTIGGKVLLHDFSDEDGFTDCVETCAVCRTLHMRDDDCNICKPYHFKKTEFRCQKCPPTCETCSSTTKCDTCMISVNSPNPYTGLCCGRFKYYVQASDSCEDCHFTCEYCSRNDLTNCYTCKTGYVFNLSTQSCKLDCGENEFSTDNISCQPCHHSCKTCEFGNLNTQCTSCEVTNQFDSGKCKLICSIDSYRVDSSNTCHPCDSSCMTCFGGGINNCLTCSIGRTLVQGKCSNICKSTEYLDFASDKCYSCNKFCLECTGSTVRNCQKCTSEAEFIEDESYCQPTCSPGKTPIEDRCLECH